MCPAIKSAGRRFAFLHRVLRDEFPCFTVLSKRYDFLPPIPPHLLTFVWWYLSDHSLLSLLSGRVHCPGLVGAHIAWWDNLREESLAGNKKASKGFESALINILKPLKLNVYIPNTDFISNPQGYLEVVERRSGNGTPGPVTVCDILRPGILDQRNVLLCTASVIISE